jgi:hypothetical protein
MYHVCNLAVEATCSAWNRVKEMINISLVGGLIGTYLSVGIGFALLHFIFDGVNRECNPRSKDRLVIALGIVLFWFVIFIMFLFFIFDVSKDDTFKLGSVDELDEDEELI